MGAHAKRPMFLVWEVTSRCNLDCLYCYVKDAHEGPTAKQIEDALFQLAEIPFASNHVTVFWTGGEPTLRPDVVWGLAPLLCDRGIDLGLCTNGTTLDEPHVRDTLLKNYKKVTISVDESNNPPSLRQGSNVDHIWSSIRSLSAAKGTSEFPVISVAVTLSKANLHRLNTLCAKAVACGVNRIEIRPLQCATDDPIRGHYALGCDDVPAINGIREIRDRLSGFLLVDASDAHLARIGDFVSGAMHGVNRCLAGTSVLFIDSALRVFPCCSYFPRNRHMSISDVLTSDRQSLARDIRDMIIESQPNNCNRCLDMANLAIAEVSSMLDHR